MQDICHAGEMVDQRLAYSIAEAAQLLGVSRSYLYAEISAGRGPQILKLGRRTLVRRISLEQWLEFRGQDPVGNTSVA
jgi:excisionase family DNA binding protein